MSTHDVFPDLDQRRNLGGNLTINLALGDYGAVLTALADAGFEVEINLGRPPGTGTSPEGDRDGR